MKKRARRSLKASVVGISKANQALLNFESKITLAAKLQVSRATIQKFFAGKPVGREHFHKICKRLKLPWQEIVELPIADESAEGKLTLDQGLNIDPLVQEVRQKRLTCIQNRCEIVRVLDMSQPLRLNDIYTNVNILEKISGRRRLEVTDLLKIYNVDGFNRPNLRKSQDRVPGIEAVKHYSKLVVLGKPGAGKTTFLKHIAIQCNDGKLLASLVPIFISLKDFAAVEQRPSLLEYITEQFSIDGITDPRVAQQLLNQGKMLVLMDGLDEVKETDSQRVLQAVNDFFTRFYANHLIVTYRLASREHTFEEFTEVEIADFDDLEITSFATKWFAIKDPAKSKRFIQKLKENNAIRELTTNPLLLTLLCLVFEESTDFPANHSELYKEGINTFLKKWDAQRNIEREQIYKQLSLQHKEDLLSQIARITFEQGNYFFRQKAIEQYIVDYICNLPGMSTDGAALQLNSAAVLKSIEAQHGLLVERAWGIYSFSHLTFQEYFTAREIVASSNPQVLETALKQLVSRITDKRWREVFLLTVGMLRNADYMLQLMKQKVERLLAPDLQLQAFLTWVNQKVHAMSVPEKPATVRAFYFDLAIAQILGLNGGTLDLARAINCNLTHSLVDRTLALDLALYRALALSRIVDCTLDSNRIFHSVLKCAISYAHNLEPQLEQILQQLQAQLPQLDADQNKFQQWWQANGQAWTEQLRAVMIAKRNIGHNWQFSKQQREALKQYYDANQLLVDCLNRNYYVTRTVRTEIEQTLLLPIAEMP